MHFHFPIWISRRRTAYIINTCVFVHQFFCLFNLFLGHTVWQVSADFNSSFVSTPWCSWRFALLECFREISVCTVLMWTYTGIQGWVWCGCYCGCFQIFLSPAGSFLLYLIISSSEKKKAAWLSHYDEISFYRLNTLSRDDNKTKFKTESTHILSQAFSGGEREFSFRSQFN